MCFVFSFLFISHNFFIGIINMISLFIQRDEICIDPYKSYFKDINADTERFLIFIIKSNIKLLFDKVYSCYF